MINFTRLTETGDYFKEKGIYQMSLEQLISFKEKTPNSIKNYIKHFGVYDTVKHHGVTEKHGVFNELESDLQYIKQYYRQLERLCFVEVCKLIIAHEDCSEELKEDCMQYINT